MDLLRRKVADMAALSEQALAASLQALTERNRLKAASVILRDQYIDELETELNRLCLEFLVRHQPVAGHLRFAFTIIQVNKELERIGDYAESIARQALKVSSLDPLPSRARFLEIGRLAIGMLRDAVQAFLRSDAGLASTTMALEEQGNSLRDAINADLAALSWSGQLPAAALNPLLTAARRFERVSDQAKNLCEEVLYMCTGEFAKHSNPEPLRILFLDRHSSCLAPMAAAIGNSLGQRRFHFLSAALDVPALDPRAAAFMAARGIDLSSPPPRSLQQIPDWERCQVIVALTPGIHETLPRLPHKTLVLTWSVPDPGVASRAANPTPAAFAAAYQALLANIRELLDAPAAEPLTNPKS
jgi:phosphate transport system protein